MRKTRTIFDPNEVEEDFPLERIQFEQGLDLHKCQFYANFECIKVFKTNKLKNVI